MDALALDVGVLVQVGVATLVGGAIGVERELRGREAGLRTMILVCLGSTIVMIFSEGLNATDAAQGIHRVDPTRIAAGIVTGIGFVGGGVILKQRHVVQGVTTAAAIWFVAGLGIAIGNRLYGLVAISTVVALVVLALLQYPEQLIAAHIYRTVTLTVDAERAEKLLSEARRVLDEEHATVMDLEAHHDVESRTTTLSFSVRTTQRLQAALVVKKLGGLEGVRRAAWS